MTSTCGHRHMRLANKSQTLLTASALAILICGMPRTLSAGVAISISIAPPVLPVYSQPPCPIEGYLWTPGYWAWSSAGYYWVPGVWVHPPQVGVLWTPGYWAFGGGTYLWHSGYWGPHVGFYGGVNYGFGFTGVGFVGGVWSGGVFRYNTAVMRVNTAVVRNVYIDRTVVHNTYVNNRVSFNGPGGLSARPSSQQQMAMREPHLQPTSMQLSHHQNASQNRDQLASVNHGQPSTAAMDTVNGRRFNQQGRMANGVSSGRLTAGETGRLENREAGLNREIHSDRQANGGTLTPQERQQVNRQQNNLSRSIYNDKHNGATARTDRKEQNINRQQNQASREVDAQKHNGKTAPK